MRSQMSIDQMLQIIESPSSCFLSNSYDSVEVPFPISPGDYLSFAQEDLKDNSERGRVNALSNAKRSFDARVESILIGFGFHRIAKAQNWNVPKKLEFVSSLGIVTPRVLTKLNRTRNLIEHEFHCPAREQVEDFVDIVALFNESTKLYLNHLPNEAEICDENAYETFFGFKFHRSEGKIELDDESLILEANDPNYERFVIAYAKMIGRLYECRRP
jgi:hypothetical protein